MLGGLPVSPSQQSFSWQHKCYIFDTYYLIIIDIVLLFNFLLRVVWVTNWMPRPAPGSNLWLRITFCETNAMISNYLVNQCQYLSLNPIDLVAFGREVHFFAKVVSDEYRFHRFTGTWQQKPFQLFFIFTELVNLVHCNHFHERILSFEKRPRWNLVARNC